MVKRKLSYTVGGNESWCIHCKEQYGSSSKKLKIELPYDPAIPLLGIYPDKTIIQKAACTPVFIYTIYNSQDMETNPMFIDRDMDEEDVVHMYNGILFSH